MAQHLSWSCLGISGLEQLDSVDRPSVSLSYLLYGLFLIMVVILLVNMMIALLSNTYNRVEVHCKSKTSLLLMSCIVSGDYLRCNLQVQNGTSKVCSLLSLQPPLIFQYPFCEYHYLELVSFLRGFAWLFNTYERIEAHCKSKTSLL